MLRRPAATEVAGIDRSPWCRMSRVSGLEQICFCSSFPLDNERQLPEEPIECRGGRDFNHRYPLLHQLAQRPPVRHSSRTIVPLGSVQGLQELLAIETDGIAKRFKVRSGNLDLDAFFVFLVTLSSRACVIPHLHPYYGVRSLHCHLRCL